MSRLREEAAHFIAVDGVRHAMSTPQGQAAAAAATAAVVAAAPVVVPVALAAGAGAGIYYGVKKLAELLD